MFSSFTFSSQLSTVFLMVIYLKFLLNEFRSRTFNIADYLLVLFFYHRKTLELFIEVIHYLTTWNHWFRLIHRFSDFILSGNFSTKLLAFPGDFRQHFFIFLLKFLQHLLSASRQVNQVNFMTGTKIYSRLPLAEFLYDLRIFRCFILSFLVVIKSKW